mgnify:CR=1 FL=1
MVGSRDSISECNVVLNTIAAEAFKEACDRLEAAEDFDMAVHDLIKDMQLIIRESCSTATVMHRNGQKKQNVVDCRICRLW